MRKTQKEVENNKAKYDELFNMLLKKGEIEFANKLCDLYYEACRSNYNDGIEMVKQAYGL
jgi:hypothetical protein